MPLEAATKISELNPLWPLGTDPKAEGDNHIRMLKEVLQKTDGGALTGVVVTVLTSSGTYTRPATLKFLEVWVVGGGGGGTRGSVTGAAQSSAAGGSGGGGVASKVFKAADVGATAAYTIAAGGASPGGAGAAGGNTTMLGMLATGGGAGANIAASSAAQQHCNWGPGGTGSGGTLNLRGDDGTYGWGNPGGRAVGLGGDGGGNIFAAKIAGYIAAASVAPREGMFPGGGAAGGAMGPSQGTATAGALGGAGCIILKEYF